MILRTAKIFRKKLKRNDEYVSNLENYADSWSDIEEVLAEEDPFLNW